MQIIPNKLSGSQRTTHAVNNLWRQGGTLLALLTLLVAGMLGGCGGGSADVSSQVVSGTAAVGAPLSGQVSLKDSSSPALQKSTVIAADGTFALDVTGLKAPYVLQAKGSAEGKNYTLHSYAEGTGTANINPLTDAIVASAAGVDDPSELFEKADHDRNHRIGNRLQGALTSLLAKLQPLLKQYSAEHTNPITAHYIANHLGLDDMFDKVKITVVNGTLTLTNARTGAVIFTGSLQNIANGIFDNGALPPATTLPGVPQSVGALGGSSKVTLTWKPVTGATSYNVYFATTPGVTTSNGSKLASVASPYNHTGLSASTSYYYVVTAVNAAGESAASAEVSATTASGSTTTTPTAPTGVQATGGTNQITLTWSQSSAATSYNIYYAKASGVTKSNGTKIANATSPSVLINLTAGTTYYLVVTAVNSAGESAVSSEASASTLAGVPALPAAPAGLSAAAGNNQITLSWNAVSGATSYNVYWSTTSGVTKTSGAKIVNAQSPYLQTGLAASTTYYYIVTAVNNAGEGAPSAQASAATAAAPVLDGMALYNANCSGCHGTSKLGKTAAAIQGAINANTGGMGYLSTLSSAEVTAIAATSAPAPVLDGAALYASYCASCHGSSKRGKSATSIQNAINSNRGGMGYLSTLTAQQVTAISQY